MRGLLFAVAMLGAGAPAIAQSVPPPATSGAQQPSIQVQAEALMAFYAAAILAGDVDGIVSLYEPEGAWFVHAGEAEFLNREAIARRYADQWEAPADFEWLDLVFVPSGEDSVSAIGRFEWTPRGEAAVLLSYHGQFVRRGDRLFIRVEDEALVPAD